MRQGQQHRRGRSRNNNVSHHPGNRKGQNPLTRSFESNGPDVKVRGTPAHVAEKYMQLARDAQSSGDHVLAENYLQHAEHYNRIILAYREQQIQQSGEMMNGNGGRQHHGGRPDLQDGDEGSDEMVAGDDMGEQPMFVRHPGAEQPRTDAQPSLDEPRQQHHHRQEPHPRFRDRQPRSERHERHEGFDRGDRSDRQGGFDRNRDRPFRSGEPSGDGRDIRMQREQREYREPREPREHREPREPRESRDNREPRHPTADLPREASIPVSPAPAIDNTPVAAADEAPAGARQEAVPRRRERFGLGADQPEFLRRPVRRPRREPEADFAPETPPAAPPPDEPPRE